jgi:hypothetical protein
MCKNKNIPVLIANTRPFRLICRDENDKWQPTLKEINLRTYDYVKLHRMSAFVDVGIAPFSLGIAFDGSLILPLLPKFKNTQVAIEIFNRTLGELLFGGIFTEAVLPENITIGRLTIDSYFAHVSIARGLISQFHAAILSKHVGNLDVIKLLNPPTLSLKKINDSLIRGRNILKKVPTFSTNMLLSGTSFFIKHQWHEALILFWTNIEQVVNYIWENEIVKKCSPNNIKISGRKAFLQDSRTWPVSTRIEVLYQKGFIDICLYKFFNNARKARNELVHKGIYPAQESMISAICGLFKLISLVISNYKDSKSLDDVYKLILKYRMEEVEFRKKRHILDNVTHWLELPPIPGDSSWGNQPYEVVESLKLKEINKLKKTL